MINLEQKAQDFASEAHKGQYRKDRITPYILHPMAVVGLIKEAETKEADIICSAWLHDTIEDCGITSRKLTTEFNSNIARIVATLTRNCSREEYKERIRNSDYAVQIIKIADVVHNCQTLEEGIEQKTIINKIVECKNFYLDLASKVSPYLYKKMLESISPWIEKYHNKLLGDKRNEL